MPDAKETKRGFDMALIERPGESGLTLADCQELFGRLNQKEAYPIEIMASKVESSAMGFVTRGAAAKLGFDYDCVSHAVRTILEDMDLEVPDHAYRLCGIDVSLER